MKKSPLDSRVQPKESQLLFSVFFLVTGIIITATGTFSKFAMGTWSGPHVRLAGVVLSVMAAYGITLYYYILRSGLKANLLLLVAFIVVLLAAILSSIKLVAIHESFRPLYFVILPLLPAHFLHKALTKGMLKTRNEV